MTLDCSPRVIIHVIDDGVGMSPDQVKTVFHDGTQFNANRLQAGGGSGLGLNIAKGMAEQHKGSLVCSSPGLDQGTTFTLSLPLYEWDEPAPSTAVHSQDAADMSSSRMEEDKDKPLHFLVVDDSPTNRKLCMRILEKHGHSCVGAQDGQEALQIVRQDLSAFDCILLDYEMPVCNGPDACKAIRTLGCSSFIVGCTGNVMSEDVEHFRRCGANWVLPKPFRMEALEQQLVEHGFLGNAWGT